MSKRNHPERNMQVAYFDWVKMMRNQDWRYRLIVANPNEGRKDAIRWANIRKQEGMCKGFPDVSIHIAARGFNAAHLELKIHPNKPSEEQIQVLEDLKKAGCFVRVVYELEHLIDLTKWYFNGDN